jgi:hypothetical protein
MLRREVVVAEINKKTKKHSIKKVLNQVISAPSSQTPQVQYLSKRGDSNSQSFQQEYFEGSSSPLAVRADNSPKKVDFPSLQALTKAAMLLPGLLTPPVHATEGDEVDFQYGHYQEGNRNLWGTVQDPITGANSVSRLPNGLKPIEVDSIHGGAKVALSDRVKFAFNFLQDTWGGATPIASSAAVFGHNNPLYAPGSYPDHPVLIGASPLLQGGGAVDAQGRPLLRNTDVDGNTTYQVNNQLTNILVSASPEVRNQGDIKLIYEWDEAALSAGGGISSERDYDSYFGNLGGLLYFNQKRTTLNLSLSYTSSDTHAIMNHDSFTYTEAAVYKENGQLNQVNPNTANFYNLLKGNREDWGTTLGLTQVINKDALISADVSYTRSTGYLANPYKSVQMLFIDPEAQVFNPPDVYTGEVYALMEKRPEVRNQVNMGGRYIQLFQPLDAALHVDYHFSVDDWEVQAHTFEADWVQPIGDSWTVTPRVRYYSQDAADFYAPWVLTQQAWNPNPQYDEEFRQINMPFNPSKLPANYSSDARLAGFGALSGGVTIGKQFAKGLSLEAGFEYYTHQSSLKLGGGGGNDFNNFDSWNVNGTLKVNLEALAQAHSSGDSSHAAHDHHHGTRAPAGVMFDHMLPQAGDFMVGYRYMYGSQSGDTLHGTHPASDEDIVANGCGPNPCFIRNGNMSMNMHMLDLMYAPTDWLTLMLMPQFVDMSMSMTRLTGAPEDFVANSNIGNGVDEFGEPLAIYTHIGHHVTTGHQSGGIGDLGIYALFKLYDDGVHHLHITSGISAPTGAVSRKLSLNHKVGGGFIDYGMQLGSGTWDFKPSLTYTGHWQQFSWGAQTSGTVRMQDHNESGYALGDQFQSTLWSNYNFTHWLTASVRGLYTEQGAIKNQYNDVIHQFGPMDYTTNYGGKYWDIGFGLSATVPAGELAGNRISVEWLQPIQNNVNGYQLQRDGSLAATWSVAF